MSVAVISYSSINNASSEASSVAKKLDSYYDKIESKIVSKINSYDGTWTSNLTAARSQANYKKSSLNSQITKYNNFADDLDALKDKCKSVDKSVKSSVENLTDTFRKKNGIPSSNILVEGMTRVSTYFGNSTGLGRFVSDALEFGSEKMDSIKENIKEWYNFEGGKEVIWGMVVASCEIVLGVVAIVGAIVALAAGAVGFAVVVAVAGIIGGVILAVNGVVNLINEGFAYSTYQNGDAAEASRLSDTNTSQDMMRDTDDSFWHNFATGIDVINGICAVISIASGLGKLATGLSSWVTNAKRLFASGDLATIKELLLTNISTNIVLGVKDFFSVDLSDLQGIKSALSSVKIVFSGIKAFASTGFTFENVAFNVILPMINITYIFDPIYNIKGTSFYVPDITLSDIVSPFKKIITTFS